ncbi:MAG TPA: DUF484 family protein [Zoogloea sp.]|uniref:DUF484 family protein n=1 Tax=Zoogloea sp. TaxID=49181 RepID=UPI002B6C775F|nr:DUF484 family protein [Zoogloea sp.]HMV17363.1 DUF484 family protein [Rhodocyclaceae bacterium]HMV64524.1 DUF484 family protein [Rhodocyclaceae bacterium]HMY49418.1 DUF484 family protein [Rhodocyclaceae bacterium]HMZ76915.1 DUF484 family protein [Rhodocyclaceae bacterium]HNA67920.1 DUF484 family protein [Rhodocyclaceae bacterium]
MNASDVVQFLKDHPGFFDDNPSLLTELTFTHPHAGQAISLTERQLLALRERIAQLEDKFAELLEFGEENDGISEKVHRLTLSLLEAEDFESIRQAIYTHLLEDFSVPHVAFRVWNSVLSRSSPEFSPVSEAVRFFTGDLGDPYCGPPNQDEVIAWFGPAARHIRSVALVPLARDDQPFGLLAMGSEDSERFYPEMGTLYVTRIGEMVACALRRQLG